MAQNILCRVIDKQTKEFAQQLHLPLKYVSNLISAFTTKYGGKSKVTLDNLKAMLKDRNDITYDYSSVVRDSSVEGLKANRDGSTTIGFDSLEGFRNWVRSTGSSITDKVIELCDETNKYGLFCGYVGMDLIQAGAFEPTTEQLHAAMVEAYNKLFSYMAEIGQLNANNEYNGVIYGTRLGDIPVKFDGESAVEFKDDAYHINFAKMQEEFDNKVWESDGLGFSFDAFSDYYIYRVSKEYWKHNSPKQNIDLITGLPTASTENSKPETDFSYNQRISENAAEMYKSFKQYVQGVKIADKKNKGQKEGKKTFFKWSTIQLHTNGIAGADVEWQAAINKVFGGKAKIIPNYNSGSKKSTVPEKEKKNAAGFLSNLFSEIVDTEINVTPDSEGLLAAFQTAKESDAVYAVIDAFARPGDKWGKSKTIHYLKRMPRGKAGITVMSAIKMQKPVHVFSEEEDSWYTFNGSDWVKEETPALTRNFAGIGSTFNFELQGEKAQRQKHSKAINAIYEVVRKTKSEGGETATTVPESKKITRTFVDPETGESVEITGNGVGLGAKKQKESKTVSQQQPVQQQTALPGPETKINIYAGTGENADLSNFAERPVDVSKGEVSEVLDRYLGKAFKAKFKTVEGAFQAMKIFFSSEDYVDMYIPQGGLPTIGITKKGDQMLTKFENASGPQARSLGRQIQGFDKDKWDKVSSVIMKALIKASFEQNPQALQRLLATGNATLTHTQDKGKWGTEFPKLLMEVRDELRKEAKPESPVRDNNTDAQFTQPNKALQAAILAAQAAEEAMDKAQKDFATLDFSFSEKKDIDMPVKGTSATRYMQVVENDELAKLARAFNPIQRANAVEYLAHLFSEYLTDSIYKTIEEMDENSQKEERAKHLMTEEGRREYINTMGVKSTIQEVQAEIRDYIKYSDEENIADESNEDLSRFARRFKAMTPQQQLAFVRNKKENMRKILDNWRLLWTEAAGIIEKLEDVKIGWDSAIEEEDADDDVDGTNAEEAREVSGNEGWAFKVNQDPKKTISSVTKRILNTIEDKNENGIITNEYGYPKFIDSGYAHAVLLSEMSKILDPDEFCIEEFSSRDENGVLTNAVLPALQEMAKKYHWVDNLITKLVPQPNDTEDEYELKKDGHLISAFFTDLRRDYIPYSMVLQTEKEFQKYDKKGNPIKGRTEKRKVWVTKGINDAVAVDSILSQVIRNYNKHTLPEGNIFTLEGGVNEDARKAVKKLAGDRSLMENIEKDVRARTMSEILRKIGFNTTEQNILDLLELKDGTERWRIIRESVDTILAGKGFVSGHYIDYFKGAYTKIAEALDLVSELDRVISFRQGDKTYQSYACPNYLTTTIKSLKRANNAEFLAREYEPYEWFYNSTTKEYRNKWLQWLRDDADVRAHLSLLDMNMMEDDEGNDVEYMNWTPEQIAFGFMAQYFSVPFNENGKRQYARYNVPIYSDSPVVTFITMPKFEDFHSEALNRDITFKEQLLPLMREVVKQELIRIADVLNRAAEGNYEQIANYDVKSVNDLGKNGAKFHFFPRLNDNIQEFYGKCRELIDNCKEDELNAYIDRNLNAVMDAEFNEYFNEYGRAAATKLAKNGNFSNDAPTIESKAEEYFWNQAYATSQIIQITTTDLAYYKDNGGIDFQKRFKEIHAAGNKLNTNSKYGRKTEYSMIFYDIMEVSNSYESIETIVYKKLAEGKIPNKMAADFIISNFREVNSTNAQAFRCPSSYRAVMDMMGKWTPEMDTALKHFLEGSWDMNDFNVVWQTIKPYMFGHTSKGSTNGNIKVPQQHKNSEFLLVTMANLIAATPLAQNGVLQAMNDFMEHEQIDVIQSEEAVKVGGQGKVNLLMDPDKFQAVTGMEPTRVNYVEYMDGKNGINTLLANGKITIDEYREKYRAIHPSFDEKDNKDNKDRMNNAIYKTVYEALENRLYPDGREGDIDDTVLHEFSYNDYCVQVPTPDHLLSKGKILAVFGSQFRNLIVSDISDDAVFDVNGEKYTKQELLDEYNALIVENLLDGWKQVQGKFASIESLQETLIHSIKSSGNYDQSLIDALQIVEVNGRKQFNIPLYNPSTTTKLQQVINSIFKNDITKQKIKGAACILVADVGKTNELKCVYEGNRLKYVECYLPAYAKKFYEPFLNKDGSLNYGAMPEELKYAIGYRIPTENKYSMAPLYIKGFLPQQNGSAIMLPADITVHAGSDFDVDKMFLMLPEFKTVTHNYDALYSDYLKYRESKKELIDIKAASDAFYEENPQWFDNIEESKEDFYEQALIKEGKSITETTKIINAVRAYKDAVGSLRELEFESDDEYIDVSNSIEANRLFAIIEKHKPVFKEYKAFIAKEHKKGFDWEPKAKEAFQKWLSILPDEQRAKFVTRPAQEVAPFKEWLNMKAKDDSTTNRDVRKYEKPKFEKVRYEGRGKDSARHNSLAARNNRIIDIAFSILTNEDTVEKFLSPGNYNNLKGASRIARITSDQRLIEAFEREFDVQPENVGSAILSKTTKELDDFLGKNLPAHNPLSPSTFIYFHRQNMTGGALIAMYANNSTINAKFQNKGMEIVDEIRFNGHSYKKLSEVRDKEGVLISQNCAEFLASAADNGKDPVLADLMQNTKTANIASLMLRLGMSVKEIGLLFTQPIIQTCIEQTGGLSHASAYHEGIETFIEAYQSRVEGEPLTAQDGLNSNLSTLDLVNAKIYLTMNGEDNMGKQWYLNQIKVGWLFANLIDYASDLHSHTSVVRADSPNGAMSHTIAGNIIQRRNVRRLREMQRRGQSTIINVSPYNEDLATDSAASMDIDDLRNAFLNSSMPILQAFYSLGIDFGHTLTQQYFYQQTDEVLQAIDEFLDNIKAGKENDEVLNDYMQSMTTYYLSNCPLFATDVDENGHPNGKTFFEKRDYYLMQFPKDLKNFLKDHKDIASMGVFKKMEVNRNAQIVLQRSGRLDDMERQALMRDFDMLLYSDDPEVRQLATDLFCYSYYKDGFNFGPNSFGILFSPTFISSFPSFVATLRSFNEGVMNPKVFTRQYILYHSQKSDDMIPFFPYTKKKDEGAEKFEVYKGYKDGRYIITVNPNVLPEFGSVYNRYGGYQQFFYKMKFMNDEVGREDYLFLLTGEDENGNLVYTRYEKPKKRRTGNCYCAEVSLKELAKYKPEGIQKVRGVSLVEDEKPVTRKNKPQGVALDEGEKSQSMAFTDATGKKYEVTDKNLCKSIEGLFL